MSKEEINYPAELVKSLKRENDLLTKDNERLKNEVEELKTALTENIMKTTPTTCEEKEPMNFSNPTWERYHFKNGEDYELALADSNGVLVFRDSIFSAQFDDEEDWEKLTNEWEKCSLKPLLEKWWEENAPDVLKNNYKITIPEAYNIFPDKLLPQDLRGKEQHWEIYKYWKNRLFCHHEKPETTTYVWTKSKHPSYALSVRFVDTSGRLYSSLASGSLGVVPACIPIKNEEKYRY